MLILIQFCRYWGVFWIDASTPDNAEVGFAKIDSHVRDGNNHSKNASYSAAMHWLLQCKKPWLLILDNADDPDMDLSRFMPAGSHGHILITTRNPNVVEYATIGHIRFHGMDPEEAISLLLKAARPADQSEQTSPQSRSLAQQIAIELGYLALPLAQAGAAIRHKIYTLERYLHYYLGHRKIILSSPRPQSQDSANIITTWEIPFQRIVRRASIEHRDAVHLLHMFAFMHFESIPEEVFQRAWNELEESQADAQAFPDILQPNRTHDFQARLRSAMRVLSDYSIAEHESSNRAFMLHPVIHAWARERLDGPDQRRWLDCAMSVLALSISPRLEASGRRFRQLLIPHMESCLKSLRQHCPRYPDAIEHANVIEKFAWVYAENGLWEAARNLQIKVIEFRKKHSGRWHASTINAKKHLGSIYWNLFDIKPLIELQLWMLLVLWFIRPSTGDWFSFTFWKPEHISYCLALDDLTQSLWLVGRRERSKQVGERAVKGLVKHLGWEDPRTLNAIFNLARTYLHLGDHEQSRKMIAYVVRMRKRFFGMEHLDTLMARNEMGVLLCAERKSLAVAEQLARRVLESRKKWLGDEHAYTLWSINDLSKILCERGHPAEAAVMLQKIIPIVAHTLGQDHVGMIMTKGNLARAFALCGEWHSAEQLLESLLSAIPKEHPDWVHTKYGYIRIQARLGKLDRVELDANDLLDRIEKHDMLAMNSPRTIAIAEELFKVYRARHRLEDIHALKLRVPMLDESNLVGDDFDVHAVRKSSQSLLPASARPIPLNTDGFERLVSHPSHPPVQKHRPLMSAHKYSPLLSSSAIRILELFPGQRGMELAYSLHDEDLTQQPFYEALSYAWGDSKSKVTSRCNGISLDITTNLRDALVDLRWTDRPRFLWVDAICIDQGNLQERGQQVSIMRHIYASATRVVVWLGRDDDGEAAKAVRFMRALARDLCTTLPNGVADLRNMDDLYDLTANSAVVHDGSVWLSIAWYFARAWFQRLWVFQEVNSGSDADVFCGDSHISWDAVGLTATYIKRWPALREHMSNVNETFWYNAYIMRSRRHQQSFSAASMLSQGQNFVTSEPLDRIYALLGTLPLRRWESNLAPDYERTRKSLYFEVAKRCLLDDNDPFLLSYAQHNDGVSLEDFPSWVPQWDQARIRVPIAIPKADWNASSGSVWSARVLGNDPVLEMQGVEFDVISGKEELDPGILFVADGGHGDSHDTSDHNFLKLWRAQRSLGGSLYPSQGSLVKAFAHTFVLGYRMNYGPEYREQIVHDFCAYVMHLARLCSQGPSSYPELDPVTEGGNWQNYMHEAHSMSYRRSFVRTKKGYMGLVPNAAQLGDIVCILFGCRVPYILRRAGDHYLHVGDAYIYEIMDGGVMVDVHSELLEQQSFPIH